MENEGWTTNFGRIFWHDPCVRGRVIIVLTTTIAARGVVAILAFSFLLVLFPFELELCGTNLLSGHLGGTQVGNRPVNSLRQREKRDSAKSITCAPSSLFGTSPRLQDEIQRWLVHSYDFHTVECPVRDVGLGFRFQDDCRQWS